MRASVYMAVSLDGFIARENGDLDWLPSGEDVAGEDHGYHAFMDTVDAIVMGRNTFEKVLSFGVGWPYADKPVVVLSRSAYELPADLPDTVCVLGGTMTDIVAGLLQRGFEHVYVDGGVTVQHFLRDGLIHRMILTVIPVVLGSGIPLFGALAEDAQLSLWDHRSWPSGLVQLTYEVNGTNT
ncbi:MAG: dihydrofolate reductase family protein [Bacteroidetes bacterium]|nr:dihydrofolate reductase family protein [Bacteroidota bacterium]